VILTEILSVDDEREFIGFGLFCPNFLSAGVVEQVSSTAMLPRQLSTLLTDRYRIDDIG